MKRARRPQGMGARPVQEITKPDEGWSPTNIIRELKFRLDFQPIKGDEPIQEFLRFMKKELKCEGEGYQRLVDAAINQSNWNNDSWVTNQCRRDGFKAEKMDKWGF